MTEQLSQEALMRRLSYDATTGVFTYRRRNARRLAGEPAGTLCRDGYIAIHLSGRKYKAHRLAWLYVRGRWPDLDLDHINGNPSDNRIANLRETTMSGNIANAKRFKNNTSGFKGVSWNKRNKAWEATIRKNYRRIHIGYYSTVGQAADARNAKALELFGEFARVA